jgi:hypothetical protein
VNLSLRGAVKGSQPAWGEYLRLKCPNWAAKFLVDAVLRLEDAGSVDRHRREIAANAEVTGL